MTLLSDLPCFDIIFLMALAFVIGNLGSMPSRYASILQWQAFFNHQEVNFNNKWRALPHFFSNNYFLPFIAVFIFSYLFLLLSAAFIQHMSACCYCTQSVCPLSVFIVGLCCEAPLSQSIFTQIHWLLIGRHLYIILFPRRIIFDILLKYIHEYIENISTQVTEFSQVLHVHSASTQFKKQTITSASETSLMLIPHHHRLYQS